ncbi:hypothetical protein [Mesorhizobium sp. M2A.F.Ca.ET.039.01.1.1]|uniref:hypothetical protein n=1 Tax=Mesorhizobium sp. M2A.F.Ca.ET.039.01.1.1 TaxID=2496746 RepID=UPI000FCB87CD|nr:hypothetical protein [Mesorhizobium sp. M2A.F.Ca.ET.039.01.1.1]RWX60992.1 hypothetical protein EOA24_31510 [Mesorhizobium sp. M2A.F.Ca.ET.039.01.1.1]
MQGQTTKEVTIPSAQELLIPILKTLKARQFRYSDRLQAVGRQFGFESEAVHDGYPAGTSDSFALHFESACSHLVKASLAARPEKGLIKASKRSAKAMSEPFWEKNLELGFVSESKIRGVKMTWKQFASRPARDRTFDTAPYVAKIAKKVPGLEMEKLHGIWRNATKMLADPTKSAWHADIAQLIETVGKEWERRAGLPTNPEDWFRWPGTDASPADGGLKLSGALKEGMFSYLEYHVGRTNGEASPVRQSILARIFESSLPPVFPKDYMAQWGQNKSAQRLKKMAETIAALTRNFKRMNDDRYDEAIKH